MVRFSSASKGTHVEHGVHSSILYTIIATLGGVIDIVSDFYK